MFSPTSSTLVALCVSDESATLRHAARLLGATGCSVRTACNGASAVAAAMCGPVDLVLVDGRIAGGSGSILSTLRQQQVVGTAAQWFHLFDGRDAAELKDAYARGFDDFLALPLDAGEVAARVRAAARMIEFHRRRAAAPGPNPETGLPNRAALAAAADECINNGGMGWIAIGDVDFFERFPRHFGLAPANQILQTVADRLLDVCDEANLLAVWNGDRFGVVSTRGNDEQRAHWIARVRAEVLATPIAVGETPVTMTASFGWAPLEQSGIVTLLRCEEALLLAKSSGRDTVCSYGDVLRDRQANDPANRERVTGACRARDVALPVTVVTHPDETVDQAQRLMEQSGVALLPVVDREGKLVGTITGATDRSPGKPVDSRQHDSRPRGLGTSGSLRYLRNAMNPRPVVVDFDATIDEAMTAMGEKNAAVVIVVRQRTPIGILTRGMIADLARPVDRRTFFADETTSSVHEPGLLSLD